MRVKVYYNIRKKCLSVMDKATRRVIKHVDYVFLSNVKFTVSQKGVERIRQQKRKAVVAFVEGHMEDCYPPVSTELGWVRVTFNPYKNTTFVRKELETTIDVCDFVTIFGREVFAFEPA